MLYHEKSELEKTKCQSLLRYYIKWIGDDEIGDTKENINYLAVTRKGHSPFLADHTDLGQEIQQVLGL